MKKVFIILIFSIVFYSCKRHNGYDYPEGKFPETPVNISPVNTVYNDYNMALPYIEGRYELFFSTDRKSQGVNYDIVNYIIYYYWDMQIGTFSFELQQNIDYYKYLDELLDSVNTDHDEFGPFSLGYVNSDTLDAQWYQLMMFSDDREENQDIYFINAFINDSYDLQDIGTAKKVRFIDTSSNEMYPTFFGEGFDLYRPLYDDINHISDMIFCSDKSGVFDIYSVDFSPGPDIYNFLSSTEQKSEMLLSMNSDYNDKCPFVNGKLMVFTSDRPGGYGGFDLYYSVYENGSWSNPVNFGSRINTQYNEYRPITLYETGFINNLMLFSSDRPGGKGGFDLYYVGIDSMIE